MRTLPLAAACCLALAAAPAIAAPGQPRVRQPVRESEEEPAGRAPIEIAALGLFDSSLPKISQDSSSVSYSARTGGGGGLGAAFNLLPELDLEIDALYAPYSFTATIGTPGSGVTVDARWYAIQIPVLARYWLLPFLSIGAGPYAAFAVTDNTATVTVLNNPPTETTSELNSAAKRDFGVAGALSLRLPLSGSSVSFVLDGRYLVGLKNLTDQAGAQAKFHHIQGLAGISLGLR